MAILREGNINKSAKENAKQITQLTIAVTENFKKNQICFTELKDDIARVRDIQSGITDEFDQLHRIHRNEKITAERLEISNWLTSVDYVLQQDDFISQQQMGTGQWFLESTEYQSWLKSNKQTLFCPGIPGAGKTTLASIVINELCSQAQNDPTIGIAFIYCSFRRQGEQKFNDLLASLLKQLAQGRSSLPDMVKYIYDQHKIRGTRPSSDDLLRALHHTAGLYSKFFIIVDALECQVSDGCRTKFISELFNLQAQQGISLFVTSRHIPEITEKFRNSESLEIRASSEDVRQYLDGHISQLPGFVLRSMELQEQVKTKITGAVDGMFLLARLHLNSLVGKRAPKAVLNALNNLASGSDAYHHAYKDVIERIKSQVKDQEELAREALSWITCARRPLSTAELQHALAVELGEPELDKDDIPYVEDIVSACAGLVIVDKESDVIRLVHYTAQEYFEQREMAWLSNAQSYITEICITYLSFDIFKTGYCTTDAKFESRLQSNALYHQAMVVSKRYADDPMYSQRAPNGMTGTHIAAFFGLQDIVIVGHNLDGKDSHGRTPLSYAAQMGHDRLIEVLLKNDGVDPDSKDQYGRTPLSFAAGSGNEQAVRLFLATGKINPNSRVTNGLYEGWTPLLYTERAKSEAVVELLLTKNEVDLLGADKPASSSNYNPSMWACCSCEHSPLPVSASNQLLLWSIYPRVTEKFWRSRICELMLLGLENSVGCDSRIGCTLYEGWTPLWYAVERGYEGAVTLLLENDRVCPDSKDNNGLSPLSLAIGNRHENVFRLLLASDRVNPDLKVASGYYEGRTPLLLAAENGYEMMHQWTALSFAAAAGHDGVVRLLLSNDELNPMSADKFGRTPLMLAAGNGHESVVNILLNTHRVDPEFRDWKFGLTSLSWAAGLGYENVVKLLLATGKVNPDFKSFDEFHKGRTPLSWALRGGHKEVVELLLATGKVDADSKTTIFVNAGRTSLSYAAESGHEDIVKLLLSTGKVNADSKTTGGANAGRTYLSYYAENGHEAIVKLLLATDEVDVDFKATGHINRGRNPLSHAAENGHETIFKLLLATGKVDADSKDTDFDSGRTPLSYAAENGHEAILKLLRTCLADS
ncbi:uncharacterized protein TRUGW13939_08160 [Talaromyces rugulosus]|uniref:Uncharacterized protein n=1 Tax=Talaromyces rugulosus TaxID=121627 RepID=A0A7H8R3U6_TALRU|nr:uncharacterized protein TRUGW13939_08160 [Talaromyces rugulosus]QKX61014.1 hypothetical protein TRUGW13939_08160 [Talaromyces rugulosus]